MINVAFLRLFGTLPLDVSTCAACGQKTRGTHDTLCLKCWKLVPKAAKEEYLAVWRLAVARKPSESQLETVHMRAARERLADSVRHHYPKPVTYNGDEDAAQIRADTIRQRTDAEWEILIFKEPK